MKIQLNTDSHVQHDPSLLRHTEETVTTALQRYAERITRVEVHVRDLNADRAGGLDKRCVIEARLNNQQPVTASEDADTVANAVTGAAKKMQRVIETVLGKLAHS